MKKYFNILTTLALFSILIYGCTVDNNPTPTPTDPRDPYLGNWSVNETELKLSYEVTIVIDSSSSTKVKIINFANAGSGSAPAIAVVSGNTITLVSNQIIGDGWEINGSGALASGKITWAYTLFDGANLHSLSAIYSPF